MTETARPQDVVEELFVRQRGQETVIPLIRLSNEDFAKLNEGRAHDIVGFPWCTNESASQVWPQPDGLYDIFALSYRGTIGHD